MPSVRCKKGIYYYRATIRDEFGKRHWIEHGGFKTYKEALEAGNFAYPLKPKPDKLIVTKELEEKIFTRFPEGSTAHIPLVLIYYMRLSPEEIYSLTVDDISFRENYIQIQNKRLSLVPEVKRALLSHFDKIDKLIFSFHYEITDHMPLVMNYMTGKGINPAQINYITKIIRRDIDENFKWQSFRVSCRGYYDT